MGEDGKGERENELYGIHHLVKDSFGQFSVKKEKKSSLRGKVYLLNNLKKKKKVKLEPD